MTSLISQGRTGRSTHIDLESLAILTEQLSLHRRILTDGKKVVSTLVYIGGALNAKKVKLSPRLYGFTEGVYKGVETSCNGVGRLK